MITLFNLYIGRQIKGKNNNKTMETFRIFTSTKPSMLLLLPLSLILIALFCTTETTALSSDGTALLALRSPSSSLDKWNSQDANPCQWEGVTCNPSDNRVIAVSLAGTFLHTVLPPQLGSLTELRHLNLSYCNLTGDIPPELANATHLQVIDLSGNLLTGSIPAELGRLSGLEDLIVTSNAISGEIPASLANCKGLINLHLQDNNLTGILPVDDLLSRLPSLQSVRLGGNTGLSGQLSPSIANCRNLTFLGLADTAISGGIPSSIGNLTNLQTLSLYNTKLTGEIPPEIGECKSLQFLYLHMNQLEGSIPVEIGKLTQLQSLLLWGNDLTGSIPSSIGNCTSLNILDLSWNLLSGQIPSAMGNLHSLQELYLSDNGLNGSIPSELGNCTSLTQMQFDKNNLSGSIPPSLGQLRSLQVMFLWNNELSGEIPPTLGGCTELQVLDLSNNFISGPIPKEIFSLPNLQKLLLLSNNLTGSLPAEVSNCISLQRLRLGGNQLSGQLPDQLGKLHNLTFLEVNTNHFTGALPAQLASLTSLQLLDLHGNAFTGILRPELGSLNNLQLLDLSYNQLTGPIPAEIGSLTVLSKLILHHNQLSGTIPPELKNCGKLVMLDLGHNQFFGSIPPEIGSITSLEIILDLSWNQLSGDLPDDLDNLNQLQALDISHNQFKGSLEVLGKMQSLTSLNVSYNEFTGSLPNTPFFRTLSSTAFLGNPGLCNPLSFGTCSSQKHSKSWGTTSLIICLLTFGAAAILFLIGFVFMFKMQKTSAVDLLAEPWEWNFTHFRKLNFCVEDVLEKLNDNNIIGKGCSGVVYRAEMPCGEVIAVKKLFISSKKENESHDSFASEIETLGHIRHRNIVRLLGYCTNRSEKLLLYDFMPNGSLADLLFEKRKMVDWDIRYKIILGAAQGLAYLHHDCVPPILHRDVKPNNILLDSKYQPFIADFGVAKLMEPNEFQEAMSKVAGSYGYIAPEYAYTLKITEKSDVFSFGVVLLEVLTGRRAVEVDPGYSEGIHIVDWVKMMKRSYQVSIEILDARLRGLADPLIQEMEQVLGIALLCVNQNPGDRPTMKDVVALLLEVKHPLEEHPKMSQPLIKNDPLLV